MKNIYRETLVRLQTIQLRMISKYWNRQTRMASTGPPVSLRKKLRPIKVIFFN